MFENLTKNLSDTIKKLAGRGRITEENIKETLSEVRNALLEADVALPVIKQFIDDIREKALGQEVMQSLRPGDTLVKIVHDEIISVLGEKPVELNLQTEPPAIILMAGLQGSGKTTTVAKLANLIQSQKKKSVLLTSADVYRPAAIEQLATLAKEIGANFFPSTEKETPTDIAKAAVDHAKKQFIDVVIIDTAGRLHVDQAMMEEIKKIHAAVKPIETLFVVDSMTGQDAANTAKAFNDTLPLTGVILTKVDGDARGGAALSVKIITGKPIKYIGLGEKIDALEPFYPERIASRILGMGDILSLVEEAQQKISKKEAESLAKKFKKGGFDFEDFLKQLQQMKKMGGVMGLLDKLPGMGNITQQAKSAVDNKLFDRMEAIINSMTIQERRFPHVINGSRKRRIAQGSGTEIQDVNRLYKQFDQMQRMMKKLKGGGMMKLMGKMKGMLPPGMQ